MTPTDLRWRVRQLPPRTRVLAAWSLRLILLPLVGVPTDLLLHRIGGQPLWLLPVTGVAGVLLSIGAALCARQWDRSVLFLLLREAAVISRLYDLRRARLYPALTLISLLVSTLFERVQPTGPLLPSLCALTIASFCGLLSLLGTLMLCTLLGQLPPPRRNLERKKGSFGRPFSPAPRLTPLQGVLPGAARP